VGSRLGRGVDKRGYANRRKNVGRSGGIFKRGASGNAKEIAIKVKSRKRTRTSNQCPLWGETNGGGGKEIDRFGRQTIRPSYDVAFL